VSGECPPSQRDRHFPASRDPPATSRSSGQESNPSPCYPKDTLLLFNQRSIFCVPPPSLLLSHTTFSLPKRDNKTRLVPGGYACSRSKGRKFRNRPKCQAYISPAEPEGVFCRFRIPALSGSPVEPQSLATGQVRLHHWFLAL
jgi:hypothetical protein